MSKKNVKTMRLLIAVIKESLIQDLLTALIELDVRGATLINTQGMGRTLVSEFPIFAGLMNDWGKSKPYNKTVFALVDDDKIIDKLHRLLKDIDIDFTQPDTGVMFTIPVSRALGTNIDYEEENDEM
ncbi:MAG: hypothetical protein H8E87_01230 [FCB group bacterium]|nr:hypothetical protein [FCB group bacterium]